MYINIVMKPAKPTQFIGPEAFGALAHLTLPWLAGAGFLVNAEA